MIIQLFKCLKLSFIKVLGGTIFFLVLGTHVQGQKVNSVVLNLSSGLTGFGYAGEEGIRIAQGERILMRNTSSSAYFFNPSIRTFDSSGFREMGLKGLHYSNSIAIAEHYRGSEVSGQWIFDSISRLAITAVGGGLYYGRSFLMRSFGSRLNVYLGVEEVLSYQYLKFTDATGTSLNQPYKMTLHGWSLLTNIIPRCTYRLSPTLILDIATPLHTLSAGFLSTHKEREDVSLKNNWFDLKTHWDLSVEVSLGIQLH